MFGAYSQRHTKVATAGKYKEENRGKKRENLQKWSKCVKFRLDWRVFPDIN